MLRAMTPAATVETPTVESLQRARDRQRATLMLLRPLGALIVVLVEISGFRNHPHPGLGSADAGAVLVALVAFAVGVFGAVRMGGRPVQMQAPFFVMLLAASATLAWLQPGGPGVLGCFVAVGAAGMRLPGRGGLAVGVAAFVVLTAIAASAEHSLTAVALTDSGIIAFYVMARLAQRLREGQDQAIHLLAELEESHRAQAEAVALAERQRLARDMHDVLAHSLSGLVLQLEGARLLAERDGAGVELSAAVDRALHLGKAGLEEARRAIGMLRDDELPGPERLPALVQDFERDAGVPCTLQVNGEHRPLPSLARLTLYRVAQEALTNVRRHAAHPESVRLQLHYEVGGTRLVVEDIGSNGATPAAVRDNHGDGGGYGITGMRERAELLGGRLDAAPTAGGFRVELWVPS